MMILWTEFLTVGGIEGVALLHLLPAEEVLHGTREATVTIEGDVQQQVFRTEALDIQGHVVVHLIDGKSDIQRLHLLSLYQHTDIGIILSLLHRQQQIVVPHLHPLHGMTLSQYLWFLLCLDTCHGKQHHHHGP